MPLSPDIKYLRVRHTGKTEGSLHLSDLDTEENKNESYKIPVYVPENGSVDLPLNDQVLLSFSQGTLRRFIDEDFLEGHVVSDDGSAEVWVSPSGDDQNPGTRNAPFESIQYAIDTIVDRVGHKTTKKVFLGGKGVFEESVIVNTRNLDILGGKGYANGATEHDREGQYAQWAPGKDGVPQIMITGMTREESQSFLDEGGMTYDTTNNEYSYTGPSLLGRDVWFDPNTVANGYVEAEVYLNISLSGISLVASDYTASEGILVLGSLSEDGSNGGVHDITVKNCEIWPNNLDAPIVVKNAAEINFEGVEARGDYFIFDTVYLLNVLKGTSGNSSDCGWIGDIYAHGGNTPPNRPEAASLLFSSGTNLGEYRGDIFLSGNIGLSWGGETFMGPDRLRFKGDVSFRGSSKIGNENLKTCTVYAENLIQKSSELVAFKEIFLSQNANITGGPFAANGGKIQGNLTVAGDVDIDLTGVHVMGDVTIDQGAGVVTWKGGSFYGTLTDDDNKLGAAVAGDYLNVG